MGTSPCPFWPHAPGHILTSGLSVLFIFSVQLTVLRELLVLRGGGSEWRVGEEKGRGMREHGGEGE